MEERESRIAMEEHGEEGAVPVVDPIPVGTTSEVAEAVDRSSMARGIEWSNELNRFAELETATAGLEAERDALKAEMAQLREQHALEGLTGETDAAVDGKRLKELEDLRGNLAEAKKEAAENLATAADASERSTKITEELRRRVTDMSRLSSEKWQAEHELRNQNFAIQALKAERDRLLQEKTDAERKAREATDELATATEERDGLRRAKETLRLELERELEDLKAEAQFHRTVATEARGMQETLRQRKQEADEKLREQAKTMAGEYAALEHRFELQSEQLRRESELRESVQKQLAEVAHERDGHESSALAASAESQRLRASIADLEKQLRSKTAAHEDLLRTRIPGAASMEADGPPEGFASLAELVAEVSSSREEFLKERRAKEELQEVLREVEREVRARYPALLSQREEAERLKCMCGQLTKQNEGLLARVRELEDAKKTSEVKKKQAQRSVQILEAHAKDMSKQLAVVVYENRKLTGALPSVPGASDLQQLETERACFRTLEGLTAQNEQLRKTVARLTEGCETKAQEELQELKEEQQQHVEEWQRHLAEKAQQMKALAETVERLTRERNEAQSALVAAEQRRAPAVAPSVDSGKVDAPSPQLTDASGLHEQIASAVREEFRKSLDGLRDEAKEARTSEVKLRQELLISKAERDLETKRKADFEEELRQVQNEMEDIRAHRARFEKKHEKLENSLRKEKSVSQDLETSLGSVRREVRDLQAELESERLRARSFEQANAAAETEKANLTQTIVDLKAQAAQDAETYAEARRDLETGFNREEQLLREQLELQIERQRDLRCQLEELSAVKTELEAAAREACVRTAELEVVNARLEAKLAHRRPVGFEETRPCTSESAATSAVEEATMQLVRSTVSHDEESVKLQEKLRFAEDREQEHVKSAELWKSLIADYEVQLEARQGKIDEVESALSEVRAQLSAHDEEISKARKREEELVTEAQQLSSEIANLQASLAKKGDEVEAAKFAGKEKLLEAENKVAALELQRERDQGGMEELRQRYRDEASAHSKDMKELEDLRARQTGLEDELEKLQSKARDSAEDAARAKEDCADQTETLGQELRRAKEHSDALALECQRYREHLATMSDTLRQQEDAPEAVQRVALEMRKASETGERERMALEIDRNRLENEAKGLRDEATDLQRRLDGEQQNVLRLQAEIRREQRAVAKLGQLGVLEDENRHLLAASRSLQERLDASQKELETRRAHQEPLEQKALEHQKQEEESERARKVLQARAEEFKRLYDEMVIKFDAYDKQHSAKQQAQMRDMSVRMDKVNEELRQKTAEAAQNANLKTRCNEASTKAEQLQKQVHELQNGMKEKDAQVQRLMALHKHGTNRVEALEKEKRDAPAANAGLLKKAEDERRVAQEKADKALGLATDYQRALETLLSERRREQQRQEQQKQQQQAEKAKAPAIPRSAAPTPAATMTTSPDTSVTGAGGAPQATSMSSAPPAVQASTLRAEAANFIPGVVGGHQLVPVADTAAGTFSSATSAQPTVASSSSGGGSGVVVGGNTVGVASQLSTTQDPRSSAPTGAKRKDPPSAALTNSSGGFEESPADLSVASTSATASASVEQSSGERAAKAPRVAAGDGSDATGGEAEEEIPASTVASNPIAAAGGASIARSTKLKAGTDEAEGKIARTDSILIEDDEAEAAPESAAAESSK